jgi:predicted nucleic acid-binding protein
MKKPIVFDTGPIISLTLNNVLWLIEPLHEKFDGEFYITPGVYDELINRPLNTKKYKFEALQILPLITKNILNNYNSDDMQNKANELLQVANHTFKARNNWIKIVHRGEMEAIACALVTDSETLVIDERTTRVLIESPDLLKRQLERKLHTGIEVNEDNLNQLKEELKNLNVIRSFELVTIAFELGLLNMFTLKEQEKVVPNIRSAVLEGVLWGVKLNGCSVKREEIYEVIDLEK